MQMLIAVASATRSVEAVTPLLVRSLVTQYGPTLPVA